jgi:hydrogenase maturation protease
VGGVEKTERPKVLIIGVGNDFRSDDTFGLLVARALGEKTVPGVTVIEHHGEGASLMEAWQGFDLVMIVDAVRSGVAPGTAFRLDVSQGKVPANFLTYSSHEFGLAEAIEAARTLGRLPKEVILYGAEGGNFDFGIDLTEPVKPMVDATVDQILLELKSRLPL